MSKRWGPLFSLLILSPVLVTIPLFSLWRQYRMPEPLTELYNAETGEPQLSEHAILEHVRHLTEDIGFRTVGTREHAMGDEYMHGVAQWLKAQCEEAVRKEPRRKLECEVWRQVGSGSHRFDIMNTRLYKSYVDLTNIIMRVSDGTPAGKEHAVLINSHLDSTLTSPGAGDDALSVGVMVETIRNLIATKGWEPTHAIIFLFNNAEESLQDGSHLYSTQHVTAPSVRAAINLEAAGTHGGELLFQATSEQMIEAYSKVPRPHGTIVAHEVFSSGVMMSDTDFRQFQLYLNVTGLDMAVVGNSYFYHTRMDRVEFIEPGVAQHMADNTLALLLHLSSPSSPLPTLTSGYTPPTTVFFSLLGFFFLQYSFRTANALHQILLTSSIIFVYLTSKRPPLPSGSKLQEKSINTASKGAKTTNLNGLQVPSPSRAEVELLKGAGLVIAAFFGSLIGVNIVAFIMSKVFDRSLSWFRVEYSCLILYGPAALAGALATQVIFTSSDNSARERSYTLATLLIHILIACIGQFFGIGSVAIYFLSSVLLFGALIIDAFIHNASKGKTNEGEKRLWLGTYAVGQIGSLLVGTEVFTLTTNIFVPLTGRIGNAAPAEHIIATIVALTTAYWVPLAVPFFHRFGKKFLWRSFLFTSLLTGFMMLVFAVRSPFDAMHPKRLFVVHLENVTTKEVSLNFADVDSSPGFEALVQDVATYLSPEGESVLQAFPIEMAPHIGDWDVFYPVSVVLKPYKLALDSHVADWELEFSVRAENDVIDEVAGTRSLSIVIHHPGLIWSTIAFDAEVLSWSLDDNPPEEHARHHIKEASFYGVDTWSVDLVIRLRKEGNDGLKVNFVGIRENAMWPGKKRDKEKGGLTMALFERLDRWMEEEKGGLVDVTWLGCVADVAII